MFANVHELKLLLWSQDHQILYEWFKELQILYNNETPKNLCQCVINCYHFIDMMIQPPNQNLTKICQKSHKLQCQQLFFGKESFDTSSRDPLI
jgi:hypothetical protein